jgi:hypothetical protein
MDSKPEIIEGSYFQKIHASSGVKFLNQLHARSFSFNIFQMNALELMEATRNVRDPEQGLSLMSQDNKEAGQQAHRELSRHVHNFVASAKTLVDHTRVFIEEHYADTTVLSSYKDQITSTFASDPVSKFVHDLRNYMLHKGLPNSHMFMYLEQDPKKPERGAELTTGIRLDTASLLEWSGWTAPAKQYIEQAGEYINIHQFSEEYLVRVNRFHSWLDALLHQHHAADLADLAKLQEFYAIETASAPKTQESNSTTLNVESQTPLDVPFTFSADDATAINEMSDALLSKVREITVSVSSPDKFPTQRPISASLTDADMLGAPIIRGHDANGKPVIIFIRTDNQLFGLSESDFVAIENITDKIHDIGWARDKLSREFIKDEFLVWAHGNFRTQDRNSFSDAIIEKSLKEVAVLEVWAPIAHLEVESQLEFGSVKISPITSEKIDSLEQMGPEIPPDQQEAVRELFANMRKELQGFAAVVITLEAEPILAGEKGLMIAQDAISLLRFFSPGAPVSRALCPTALLGAEIVPQSKLLVLSDSSFSITDKISSRDIAFWKLPKRGLEQLEARGFRQAGSLVSPAGLSNFAASVRSSLITYGKGTTFPDLIDRLTHALSALEGVFLRHSMEPVESNIADRISFVLSKQESERAEIAQNIRQAYRLEGQYRTSPLSPREQDILARFIFNAHVSLQIALQNVASFQTKAEFIAAVDRLGVAQSAS